MAAELTADGTRVNMVGRAGRRAHVDVDAFGGIALETYHARLIVHVATTVGVFLYEAHDRNPVK